MAFVKFMRNKFFHPHTFENQKRTWIAEQNAEAEKKKQEDLHKTYLKEQAIYENKNLLRTGKLTQDDKLAFMYEPPLECRKKDEKLELREVRFEWQKNAPRTGDYARNLEVNDCPFGIEVRNTKCIKCSVWGHMNTDKICPLYNQGMHNDENPSELGKEDPMVLLKAMESGGLKMRKHAVNSVMDVASNKYKLLEADKVDPEVAFIANLTDKQKRKLMKKLNKSSLGVGGAHKSKSKKHKKEKKKKSEKKKKDNDMHSSSPLNQDNKDDKEIKSVNKDYNPSRGSGSQLLSNPQNLDDPSHIKKKRHGTDEDTSISNQSAVKRDKDRHQDSNQEETRRRRHDSDRIGDSRKRQPSRDEGGPKSRNRQQRDDCDRHYEYEDCITKRNSPNSSLVKTSQKSSKGKEVVRKGSERHDSDRYDRKEHTVKSRRSNCDRRNRNSPEQVRRNESNLSNTKPSRRYRSSSTLSSSHSPTKEKKKTAKSTDRKRASSSSSNSDSDKSLIRVKNSGKKFGKVKSKKIYKSESSSSSDDCIKKSRKKR